MGLPNRSTLKSNSKEEIYFNAIMQLIETKGPIDGSDRDVLKQVCFVGVKYVNEICKHRDSKEPQTVKYMARFTLMELIMGSLALLTPQELMIMYPITKKYDGHKRQMKDYFTTLEDISSYPLNEPIGRDNMLSLLWDYQNWDLTFFLIEYTSVMSDLYRVDTGKGIMEQFLEDNGVETFTFHEKEGYIQSNKTGKVSKVTKPKKRIPKQFRVVR